MVISKQCTRFYQPWKKQWICLNLTSAINYKTLGVSKERWSRYIEMMVDVGYIKGVRVGTNITGETIVECDNIRITLKGLEYLQENSIMKKIYNAAKGIKEITPGL